MHSCVGTGVHMSMCVPTCVTVYTCVLSVCMFSECVLCENTIACVCTC